MKKPKKNTSPNRPQNHRTLKKTILFFVCLIIVVVASLYITLFLGQTKFQEPSKFLYIPTSSIFQSQQLLYSLDTGKMIGNKTTFQFYANRLKLWKNLKPGRYEITKNMSIYDIINKLKYGGQTPVSFVLKKVRSKEQIASLCGNYLESDSTAFATYFNSLELQEKTNINDYVFMSYTIPNTYYVYWNTTPEQFMQRMIEEHKKFWNLNRLQKAALLKLNELEVYTLASIIEEETLKHDEKPTIASVYLNRLKKGMKLEADPTVKFCTKDFGIRRVRFKHVNNQASCLYNTYQHRGLPPGPICTPSVTTIDAVLHPANTNYLYFCAKPERDGYHSFCETYSGHLENARRFHQMLNANKIH